MQLYKNKIVLIAVSAFLCIVMLFSPLIVAAGVVAVPVVAIHELFTSIGDFLFGDQNVDNEVVKLINHYLEQDETKKNIKEIYQSLIEKEKDVSISLNWLVIPNLLAGVEEVKKDMIQQQIDLVKTNENNLETYINQLREREPWKTGFANVSTTTIVGYINQFNSYLGQEESIDIGDLKEEEFLYPLVKRAVVTSEFGQRWPVILPNGQVVNQPHTGTDLAYPGGDATTCGVPIYASMPGEVVATEKTQSQEGANWGAIRYKNLEIWYLHLRDPFPYEVGEKIKKGQFIGYIGSTGLSTACHLHYETHVNGKAVDARNFLEF